jgi:flagellar M-ring protein FliF
MAMAGGVPGTQSALPDGAKPGGGSGGTIRRTESATYQTSKKVRHTARQQGDIKRITVAVLLDQESKWEGSGKEKNLVITPPSPERVETIRNLVTNVTGLNLERGDQLTVETLPFASTLHQDPPEEEAKPAPPAFNLVEFFKDPKVLGGAGGVLVVILGLAFWLMKRAKRSRAKAVLAGASALEASASAGTQLNAASTGLLSPQDVERLERDLLESLKLQPRGVSKSETLAKYLRGEVKKDPRAAADLLRHWLLEEGS